MPALLLQFHLPRVHCIMAATQKLYPRGTVKRIVKAHSNKSVSKNADILVCLKFIYPGRIYDVTNPVFDWMR